MIKEETVQGMRVDTFLVESTELSKERLYTFRTKEDERKIREELVNISRGENRLPG